MRIYLDDRACFVSFSDEDFYSHLVNGSNLTAISEDIYRGKKITINYDKSKKQPDVNFVPPESRWYNAKEIVITLTTDIMNYIDQHRNSVVKLKLKQIIFGFNNKSNLSDIVKKEDKQ